MLKGRWKKNESLMGKVISVSKKLLVQNGCNQKNVSFHNRLRKVVERNYSSKRKDKKFMRIRM